jgi:hypothetical protein
MLHKKSLITPLLLVCLFCCLAAVPTGPSGKWSGQLMTADSTAYPLTYNFTLTGDSLTGTAKSQLGEFPIAQGRLDTAGLHFNVTVNGLDIVHEGRLYPDSIGMNISANGSTVHCTLVRTVD